MGQPYEERYPMLSFRLVATGRGTSVACVAIYVVQFLLSDANVISIYDVSEEIRCAFQRLQRAYR